MYQGNIPTEKRQCTKCEKEFTCPVLQERDKCDGCQLTHLFE